MPHKAADPEIIKVLLKQEIIRLGIQNNPSRTVYQERYHRGEAPSPNSAMQITKMSWSDLVHDLGFNYDAKKNIAQNGKKGASKHLGTKQSIRLADPKTCEQVVNNALELMRYGFSFEELKKRYTAKYGESIRKTSRWSKYSNADLMFLVVDYMKAHELTGLHQYTTYLNVHSDAMPATETLKKRLQLSYSELNRLLKILLQ
ncbi:hypothetical protein [Limosilactobacillus pulli]|uniref:hypothetical protein n=1 Tax=Limosilactobacillus pulli TaxID=2991833 RepID=UPI0024BBDEDF|nr:hypothetical protein [Limosilactobacillus pulli]